MWNSVPASQALSRPISRIITVLDYLMFCINMNGYPRDSTTAIERATSSCTNDCIWMIATQIILKIGKEFVLKLKMNEQGNGSTQIESGQTGQRYIHCGQSYLPSGNLCKDYWSELLVDFMCRVCTCNRIRVWSEVHQNWTHQSMHPSQSLVHLTLPSCPSQHM